MGLGQLIGLHYSPWTERARWALELRRVPFRYTEYVPMVGEPYLRLRARRWGKLSVPMYLDEGDVILDSTDIVRHADRVGEGEPLEPAGGLDAWAARIEPGLQAARALVTARVLADPEALREAAMAVSPAALAGAMRPVAALGARFIAAKYGADLGDGERHRGTLRDLLVELSRDKGDRPYFVDGRLTAADIFVATLLQAVQPARVPHLTLPPATQRAWTTPELASDAADLLAWRDELYVRHRVRAG